VVYALIGLIGAIATFYLPARSALLPNLIPVEQLVKANTLFATSLAATTVGGRALGGFVAEVCGVKWAILANAVAYVISVALLWQIRMDPHATTVHEIGAAKTGGWREFRDGMAYLWKHPVALPLVVLAGVFAFLLGVLMVAFVGYAMDTLGLRTGGVGYLIGAAGIGAGLGIVGVSRGKRWMAADWLPAVQLLVAAGVLVLLSFTTTIWVAAGLVVVLGAVAATVMIQIDAKMQAQVEDARRGAVFAARGMLTSATMLVAFWLQFGTAFFRETAPPVILFGLGVGAAVLAVLTLVALRRRVSGTGCAG
jgi:predicted MFS family arabinose efflux permease